MTEAYSQVPQEMKDLPRWVLWKLEPNDKGKLTKTPKTLSGYNAASDKPSDWTTFDKVKHIEPTATSGIGFVFNDDGITGIDLDNAFNPDGSIYERFKPIVETLKDTYIEISPSGKGLHIILRCDERVYTDTKTGGKNAKHKDEQGNEHGVEIYHTTHYFTVTGNRYGGSL